jgi:uncharacterized protein
MQKMLVILIGENDRWEDQHLYEAIARKLVQIHARGATVHRGIMGFGSHQKRLHQKQLFGISDDRPVSISVIDAEDRLRTVIIPAIQPMIKHGLMFLSDVEVIPTGNTTPKSPAPGAQSPDQDG